MAILDFTNGAADAEELTPLGKGLQSMLITDLSAVENVTLIERERLQEVLAELEFQQSDYVDRSTAGKLGEVLGITHLLTGSFVVQGETMRLDARLVALAGDILLATDVAGEKDAFFELEKDLARALASKLAEVGGTPLAPKTRAKLATIHTADFGAFRTFSDGLASFDRADYDAALEQLRSATVQDEDFDLARLTLKDYEQIVSRLRARTAQLETGRKERERLEKDRERADLTGVLSRLWTETEAAGAAGHRRRVTALYLLAIAYGNIGRNRGKLLELRQVEDRFAMQRTADALALAYKTEAMQVWPALPPNLTDRYWRGLPEASTFEQDFAEAVDHLFEYGADHPENRRSYTLSDLNNTATTARMLHLDRAEEVAWQAEMERLGADLGAPDYWLADVDEELVDAFRSVLRLDDSTRRLTARARGETNEWRMKSIADAVERNRELAEVLETSENADAVREWLLLGGDSGFSHGPLLRLAREHLLGASPDAEGLYYLNRARELDSDDYLLVGGVPVWAHQAQWRVRSGPRSDLRRAEAIRYVEEESDAETPTLLLLGGTPKQDLTLKLTAHFEAAPDFWPRGVPARDRPEGLQPGDVPAGHPSIGILLGMVDVNCKKQKNPHTDKDELVRPTRGAVVTLTPDGAVELSGFVESERGSYDRKDAFELTPWGAGTLPKPPRGRADAPIEVVVTVRGDKVSVTARGHTSRFKAPEPLHGFVGLLLHGQGYVEIADLQLD